MCKPCCKPKLWLLIIIQFISVVFTCLSYLILLIFLICLSSSSLMNLLVVSLPDIGFVVLRVCDLVTLMLYSGS